MHTIKQTVKLFEDAIKNMINKDRLILAYALFSSVTENHSNFIYGHIVFDDDNIDKDHIQSCIDYSIERYYEKDEQYFPFDFLMIQLLLCLKYLSLKDRIKVIYMYDAVYSNDDWPFHIANEEDEKELEELKKTTNFDNILFEKDKELAIYTKKNLLEI